MYLSNSQNALKSTNINEVKEKFSYLKKQLLNFYAV